MLDDALSVVMGVNYDDVGTYIASELDFLTKCRLIKGIRRNIPDDLQRIFAGLFKELEEQNTFRNSLVHGAWTGHSESDHTHGVWSKDGLSRRYNSKPFYVTCEELNSKAKKLDELTATIKHALRAAVRGSSPSPAKP